MLLVIQQGVCERGIKQLHTPYSVTANQKQRAGVISRRNYRFILPLCNPDLHVWAFQPHPLLNNFIRLSDFSSTQVLFLPGNITFRQAPYAAYSIAVLSCTISMWLSILSQEPRFN